MWNNAFAEGFGDFNPIDKKVRLHFEKTLPSSYVFVLMYGSYHLIFLCF